MTNILEIKNLHKSFGTVQALRGVSWGARSGELLALLGPNGAGKTTTVRAIAGRVVPDQGEILLLGKRLPRTGGRETLGIVPQTIAIYTELTTRENLQVWGRLNGVSSRELPARVEWALRWTGLADRANEPTKNFSGGMQRRVNIACGVVHRPQVVLLDEPTVGVDPQSRERIYEMLNELRNDGTTIVLTTHHLDEAEARCDRIVIIDQGVVVADGTLTELVQQTIGLTQQVIVSVDSLDGSRAIAPALTGLLVDGPARLIRGTLIEIGSELPRMLERVVQAGCEIRNVQIRGPSLHSVFLHLTGKELRE